MFTPSKHIFMRGIFILLFLISPHLIFAQYLEDFSGQNGKGVRGNCTTPDITSCDVVNLTDVDWALSGNFFGLFTGERGGFVIGEALVWDATLNTIIWESPTLDISKAGGTFDISVDITSINFINSVDDLFLQVSVDGGAFSLVDSYDGFEATLDGSNIPGTNTLIIRIEQTTLAPIEVIIDNISVPQAENPALPVDLVSFRAFPQAQGTLLKWQTASESNSLHFEIQKSHNAQDFSPIGLIDALGNSIQTHQYTFLDTQSSSQTAYYRLKQVDQDSSFAYSETISVKGTFSYQALSPVYPNPGLGDQVFFDYQAPEARLLDIQVFTSRGIPVLIQKTLLVEGKNQISLAIQHMPPGAYQLRVQDGVDVFYHKFILACP